jgi:large subunit ribosomal protein L23
MNALNVILGPIISEKSMNDASKGKYTFKVFVQATKKDIKEAIEKQFKVNVLKVATVTVKGRSVRAGARRAESLKQPFKKAILLVKEGQKIPLFDTGAQK